MNTVYLIGSLRNPQIPRVASAIRGLGLDVFDDWWAASEDADDWWQKYEQGRGRSYQQALEGYAANHVFEFDEYHLGRADVGVLVMPAGKSGHIELGVLIGQKKPTFVYFPDGEPERWDVMYRFCTAVVFSERELLWHLEQFAEKAA